MADFLDQQRTLENYWPAVILFGQNVASPLESLILGERRAFWKPA